MRADSDEFSAGAPLGELVPVGGGDPIPLRKPKLLIGRRSNCDITLDFPNVSSRHCELEFEKGYWKVRDLGSRNGLKVNGDRVETQWLRPGDELSVAKHLFEVQYTPTGDAPPPVEIEENGRPFGGSLLEKAGLVRPERRPERRPTGVRSVDPQTFSAEEDEAAGYLLDE